MSGEMCSPKNSASSPTLEMMVISDGRWTASSPWRKRAAPTPPARTVIKEMGKGESRNEAGRGSIQVILISHFSFCIARVPKLAGQLHLPEMLAQVLDRVQECPGRRHFDRVAGIGPRVRAADRAPVHRRLTVKQRRAFRGHPVEEVD